MKKEEFIKQRCEIDNITEEEFEETYRVIECNCRKPYCKGYRCLDLDDLYNELKKQKEIIDRANSKLDSIFANGDDEKILGDLLELNRILENKENKET